MRMRIVVNTILNSLIKEFIKLIANYSKGYKKLINSSLPPTHRVNLGLLTKWFSKKSVLKKVQEKVISAIKTAKTG